MTKPDSKEYNLAADTPPTLDFQMTARERVITEEVHEAELKVDEDMVERWVAQGIRSTYSLGREYSIKVDLADRDYTYGVAVATITKNGQL